MVSFCLDVFFLGRGKKKALLQTEYRTSLDGQVHCMVFFVGRKFFQTWWSALRVEHWYCRDEVSALHQFFFFQYSFYCTQQQSELH